MKLAPRELTLVVDRVLLRSGYPPGVSLTAAQYLTAGELARGGYAATLVELLPELPDLVAANVSSVPSDVPLRIDAAGAFSLVVAADALDLLDSAWSVGGIADCTVDHARFPDFVATIVPVARERGIVVEVRTSEESAACVVVDTCVPEPALAEVTAVVVVPDDAWASLLAQANEVLATATTESRRDAGY